MLKREFKVNAFGCIIWFIVLVATFLMVYMIYPFIMTEETIHSMEEMMNMLPPEMVKAFNMDINSITTAYGWVSSEGFMYALLFVGIYSAVAGGNAVLKEESEKTIEYLGVRPIKRRKILTYKIVTRLCYILGLILAFGIFNFIALLILGDLPIKQFLLLSISPVFIALPLFAFMLFISTNMHKGKKIMGWALGIVFISYIIHVIAELSTKVEFFKFFSIYTLADTRNIITNTSLNWICVVVSLALSAIFISLSYLKYQKKELM